MCALGWCVGDMSLTSRSAVCLLAGAFFAEDDAEPGPKGVVLLAEGVVLVPEGGKELVA